MWSRNMFWFFCVHLRKQERDRKSTSSDLDVVSISEASDSVSSTPQQFVVRIERLASSCILRTLKRVINELMNLWPAYSTFVLPTDMNKSCGAYDEFFTHLNASCHVYMYDHVAHIWMSHVTHMSWSCCTYEWVMSREWVMSHMWRSHVEWIMS